MPRFSKDIVYNEFKKRTLDIIILSMIMIYMCSISTREYIFGFIRIFIALACMVQKPSQNKIYPFIRNYSLDTKSFISQKPIMIVRRLD